MIRSENIRLLKLIFFGALALAINACTVRNKSAISKETRDSVKSVTLKIAENIINNTSFRIIDTSTKELFETTAGLRLSPEIKIESPYNQWQYWNGVVNIGMIYSGKIFNEQKCIDYAKRNYQFMFDNLPYFEKHYLNNYVKPSLFKFFRMSCLDDCGAMAAGLADVYGFENDKRYFSYLQRTADYITKKQNRLPDGTLARPVPDSLSVWADDLYMSVPFLARFGKITNDTSYWDDACNQVKKFQKYLVNRNNGLYAHCWYNAKGKTNGAYWARCNGWILMAEVELLNCLPESYPQKEKVMKIFQQHVKSLVTFQNASGLWHQLLDKEDSYLETSASAMFVYSIAKGINEGWIESRYDDIALKGWNGLLTMIDKKGNVDGICIGTNTNDDLIYYYQRPYRINDIHGLGAVLLAGAEVYNLR